MRVLHVGWGFFPWRHGGLIHYAEDLMAAQASRGHDVAYFFSGRHYPRVSGPRLKRWRRDGVAMHEVLNGPIVSGLELGTAAPDLDLQEPRLETAFGRVVRSFQPDVVHFQELLCLPSSLIDVAVAAGVPTVMSLQDYLPLCSTLRLFDADGRRCERIDVGADCAVRNARAPVTRAPFMIDTYHFEVERWRRRLRVGRVGAAPYGFAARRAHGWLVRQFPREVPLPRPLDPPASFRRRREVNVERLGRVGRLIAQSARVAEIYVARGVVPDRMTTLRFTLAHIERLRPRSVSEPPAPVTFATLGGCASVTKGAGVVLGAVRALHDSGHAGRFRLRVLGGVDGSVRDELERFAEVEIAGLYGRAELDSILDDVDVGLIPSVWEEAFGYSGVELLAKGIPLIANPLGGIVDYAREGETAWHNADCSAMGMADLMARLIAEPARIVDMHRRVIDARERIVQPMSDHVDAVEAIYRAAAVS